MQENYEKFREIGLEKPAFLWNGSFQGFSCTLDMIFVDMLFFKHRSVILLLAIYIFGSTVITNNFSEYRSQFAAGMHSWIVALLQKWIIGIWKGNSAFKLLFVNAQLDHRWKGMISYSGKNLTLKGVLFATSIRGLYLQVIVYYVNISKSKDDNLQSQSALWDLI